ncbi:MAG: biliverdin-producing heme oxygenase [Bdellovibrionia bacterium]
MMRSVAQLFACRLMNLYARFVAMIRELLREHTQASHQRLEHKLDLLKIVDLNTYSRVVARFYGFVEPLEAELSRVSAKHSMVGVLFQDERLSFAERMKTQWLKADLDYLSRRLGASCKALEKAPHSALPCFRSPASVLGCLYVMEGSTLGGQFLSAHFEKSLGLNSEAGLSYFSGYGAQTGKMWRSFLSFLEEHAQRYPEWTDEILSSANETFEKMENWLT